MSSKILLQQLPRGHDQIKTKFTACKSFYLKNQDRLQIGEFVLASLPDRRGKMVGKCLEILQITGSDAEQFHQPDIILLLLFSTSTIEHKYYMPKLQSSGIHILAEFKVCDKTLDIFLLIFPGILRI